MVGDFASSSTTTATTTRSASEKEKTKLRERQRRAITTKIFHGLRRHGGYHLPPRADINEVLRELAREAGWIVEPDGTTYRCKLVNRCPSCGTMPSTSSTTVAGGGECSTTSPRWIIPNNNMVMINENNTINMNVARADRSVVDVDTPFAFYMYDGVAAAELQQRPSMMTITTTSATFRGGMEVATSPSHQQPGTSGSCLPEAGASNQNTPVGSPLHQSN